MTSRFISSPQVVIVRTGRTAPLHRLHARAVAATGAVLLATGAGNAPITVALAGSAPNIARIQFDAAAGSASSSERLRMSEMPVAAIGQKALPPNVERAWFVRERPALALNHPGKYVAVHGLAVVDEDEDLTALVGRFYATHPGTDLVYFGFPGERAPTAVNPTFLLLT
jgi:hypothetical protein